MSDAKFHKWVTSIIKGETHINITIPVGSSEKIDVEECMKLAEEIGHKFFSRLIIDDGDKKYLAKIPTLQILLPISRPSQLLTKKMSLSKSSTSTDAMSGQAPGAAASISGPELQIMSGVGQHVSAKELVSSRGGDPLALRYHTASVQTTGAVNTEDVIRSGSQSGKTTHTWFVGKHIGNNF